MILVETVADFIFLCSKITTDGDCSHKIKRHLLLGDRAGGKEMEREGDEWGRM